MGSLISWRWMVARFTDGRLARVEQSFTDVHAETAEATGRMLTSRRVWVNGAEVAWPASRAVWDELTTPGRAELVDFGL